MKDIKLIKYILLSLLGVITLFVVPFMIAQKYIFNSGLITFSNIFNNTGFIISFKNTFIFMAIFVTLVVILGFVLAFMTEYLKLSFWVKASVILPITMPAVSVAGFFREISKLELLKNINGLYVVGLIFLWSTIGYTYIIFLISFKNRDKTVEEAAYLDGAGTFRTLFTIIIPLHVEAMILSVIISIYNSLKIFKMTYAIYGEFPDYRMFMMQNFLHIKLKELDLRTLMTAADLLLIFILALLVVVLVTGKQHKKKLLR